MLVAKLQLVGASLFLPSTTVCALMHAGGVEVFQHSVYPDLCSILLASNSSAGILATVTHRTRARCSLVAKTANRRGGNATCTPGCTREGPNGLGWCSPSKYADKGCVCGRDMCGDKPPQPWRPTDFAQMLDVCVCTLPRPIADARRACLAHCPPCPHRFDSLHVCCVCPPAYQVYDSQGGSSNWFEYRAPYNEFIVHAKNWNDRLPNTIEAFYFHCGSFDPGPENWIRSVRLAFLKEYSLESWKVPLLCLNIDQWGGNGPFQLRS